MENQVSLNRYIWRDDSTTQELDKGFRDWVRWLRFVTDPLEGAPPAEQPARTDAASAEPSPAAEAQAAADAEWRWQDDGGESAETV